MSATYQLPWQDSRDYVRFLAGDTGPTFIFQDEEYDGLLGQWGGDARMVAADALERIAGLYARQAISYSISGFSMNRSQTHDAILGLAKALREEAQSQPFEFESVVDHAIDPATGRDWSRYITTSLEGGNWPP